MIKVIADANIYISSIIFAGIPRQFVQSAESGKFQLAISNPLIVEIRRVLLKKFAWSEKDIAKVIFQLTGCTTLVQPSQTINAVPSDPDDNRVLECAVTANSRYIVTGDNDLLRLESYGDIRIVKVADFLQLIPPG